MVVQDEDWAVHNVHLLGRVAGREGCVSSDHHQLVAGLLQSTTPMLKFSGLHSFLMHAAMWYFTGFTGHLAASMMP